MRNTTFIPHYSAADRSRLDAEARAEATRLRTQAIREGWSALHRLAAWMVASTQRRWRAVSP
jgi:hypothetical protein